jgi:hypothetical protein
MKDSKRIADVMVRWALEGRKVEPTEIESSVGDFTKIIEERFGQPNLPNKRETSVVTIHATKTAALFFDRVWSNPAILNRPPDDISFFGATYSEVLPGLLLLATQASSSLSKSKQERLFDLFREDLDNFRKRPLAKTISGSLFMEHGISAVPMYKSVADCNDEYKAGQAEAIIAVIDNLGIVNEEALSWAQVGEFRKDTEAKNKLRKMRFWLDSELSGKSISHISDAIAIRVEDYEWAIKKHGIQTAVGALSELLDLKFLPAASAAGAALALAAGPLVAALGVSGLVAGKTAISLANRLIDLRDIRRGKNSEVAFIHELKKLKSG